MKRAGCAPKRGLTRDVEADLFARRRAIDSELLDQTARLFEARMGRSLSQEDARQIIDNLGGFFSILAEWDRIDRRR
ncbi:MAG: hypothetical protein M9905_15820 [Rhizobiaceae bacterium]|nr:hypothetical protein [Rhizobiaceae bacterium]